jgi:hypothetical protein
MLSRASFILKTGLHTKGPKPPPSNTFACTARLHRFPENPKLVHSRLMVDISGTGVTNDGRNVN